MHVLIAEDQPDVRRQLAIAFKLEGHQTTLVHDGAAAVEAITTAGADEPFDAVLIDVQMPVLDGLTAARRIRMLPAGRDLRIVLLTAFSYTEREAREAGADVLLRKPLSPLTVVAQVADLL